MTTFYDFTLKIETSWVERVDKPISEIRNANDVIVVYVGLFILG